VVLDDPEGKINLSCTDTISNNEMVARKNVKIGDSFLASCIDNCVKEVDSTSIYGSTRYSDDSVLCLSAYHAGSLLPEGGNFMVKLNKGLTKYESENRNGIISKTKKGDVAAPSITFEMVMPDDMIDIEAVKEGMKVDVYDKNTD